MDLCSLHTLALAEKVVSEREALPQRLKPIVWMILTARLKPCPSQNRRAPPKTAVPLPKPPCPSQNRRAPPKTDLRNMASKETGPVGG